jgi:hypothetical protein
VFSSDFSGLTLPVVEFRCINGGLLPGRRPLRLDGDEPGEDRAGGGGGRVALSMLRFRRGGRPGTARLGGFVDATLLLIHEKQVTR